MKKIFIKAFGWPLVTVARDGFGNLEEDKCFGIKGLWRNLQLNVNLMHIA